MNNEILFKILRIALISGAVGLVFKLAAKYLPDSKTAPMSAAALARRDKVVYNLIFLLTIGLGVGFYFLMAWLVPRIQDLLFIGHRSDVVYVLHANMTSPDSANFVPIFFIPLAGVSVVALYFTKLYLKFKNRDQNVEGSLEALASTGAGGKFKGINMAKLARLMAYVVIPPSIFLLVASLKTYSIITTSSIISSSYFSFKERQYNYTDISKILLVKSYVNRVSQEIEPIGAYYTIIMKNGYAWTTNDTQVYQDDFEKEVFNYISTQSGVPIKEGVRNRDDKP